jgi:hypothetical protein
MPYSLSQLGTFEKCGGQYKFRYVDGLRGPTRPSAQRGVDRHAYIEDYLKGTTPLLHPELSFYGDWLGKLKTISGILPEAQIAVDRNWQLCSWTSPEAYSRSVLDLLVPPFDGIARVYDWKTGKVYDDHVDQRDLYAIKAFIFYPDADQVAAEHIYVDLHVAHGMIYHRFQLPDLKKKFDDRYAKLGNAINTGEFVFNPGPHCNWCPFSRLSGGPCEF